MTDTAVLLSEETLKSIDHWVAKFPPEQKRSALIQSLMAAQEQNGGWLNRELIEAVAEYLGLPPVWAFEVASFYSMFHQDPVGRNKVNICLLYTSPSPRDRQKSRMPSSA